MSLNSFRMEVYLPDFSSAFKFCKEKYPDLALPEMLNQAWKMTEKVHFHMTNRDKLFLFRCVN